MSMLAVSARPLEPAQWTLRVSSNADSPGAPAHVLLLDAAELIPTLTRLLHDERVNDVVVAPRAREVRARVDSAPDTLAFGDAVVDVAARSVHLSGARVELTRRELDLLMFLVRNPDRAWSREALLARVWGSDALAKRRTVDIHVRRLRAKLSASADALETLVGVGYRWTSAGRERVPSL